ncbi:MAG: NfeD family protein [Desulfurococcaceae archaeon]
MSRINPSYARSLFFFLMIILLINNYVYIESFQGEIIVNKALLLEIAQPWDTIDSGVAECVLNAVGYAESRGYALIYKVNSYGGYLDPAFTIGDSIYYARIPTIAYVEIKALSAGTMIILPADIIVMQEGAIIGAMKPVYINPATGEMTFINESKILNPIIETALRFARKNNRNETLVREFIVEAVTVNSSLAVSMNLADHEVREYRAIFDMIRESRIEKDGKVYVLRINEADVELFSCSIRSRFLSILSNAYLANVLLSIGVLAAIFALASGKITVLPLALALILLALIGTGINPNLISVFFIILGSVLLAVELFILPGFGVVGISGIVLLLLGFALLPAYIPTVISPTEEYINALRAFIFGTSITLGSFFGIVIFKVIQVRRKKPYKYTPEGKVGFAIDDIKPGGIGYVKIEGEYWRAVSNTDIKSGDKVIVISLREDGVLIVAKKEEPH